MARRPRVEYRLTRPSELVMPTTEEQEHILRAADDIIATAGRTMLAKILKGSTDKKVLEHGLTANPAYGSLKTHTLAQIGKMVDWMIYDGWLELKYQGRLPLIVFTPRGWERYKPLLTQELHSEVLQHKDSDAVMLVARLKETNREIVLLLLENIAASKNIGTIRFLRQWRDQEVKKVRTAITKTIKQIKA